MDDVAAIAVPAMVVPAIPAGADTGGAAPLAAVSTEWCAVAGKSAGDELPRALHPATCHYCFPQFDRTQPGLK